MSVNWLLKYACLALVFTAGFIGWPVVQGRIFNAASGFRTGLGLRRAGWQNLFPFNYFCKRRRLRLLERQLPDALELVGNSLSAGLSLLQALEAAAEDAPQPVSEIFMGLVRDVGLGAPVEEALQQAAQKWQQEDFAMFAAASAVANRTGANPAALARRLVHCLRERRQWQERLHALTAQARLSGWIVGLLPAGLLLALSCLEPDLLREFFRQPPAWALLGCGLAMELLGLLWIRRIMRIEA